MPTKSARAWLVFALLAVAPPEARACQVASQAEQDAKDAADRADQRMLVSELIAKSDAIVLAKAIAASDAQRASFSVTRSLKGNTADNLDLTWEGDLVLSCQFVDSFKNVRIKSGDEYLLYISAGRILRAGAVGHRYGEIPYREELRLVRRGVGN